MEPSISVKKKLVEVKDTHDFYNYRYYCEERDPELDMDLHLDFGCSLACRHFTSGECIATKEEYKEWERENRECVECGATLAPLYLIKLYLIREYLSEDFKFLCCGCKDRLEREKKRGEKIERKEVYK